MTRVTHQAVFRRRIAQLNDRGAAVETARQKAATGRAFQRASDAPAAASKAADLRANLQRLDVLSRTHSVASGELAAADTALGSLTEVMDRLLFIGRAAAGSRPATEQTRAAYVDELTELRSSILGMVNTTYAGRPLFAGTADVGAAYDAAGTYQGNAGDMVRTIAPQIEVTTNVQGPDLLAGAATRDLVAVIDDMIVRLTSTNPADHDLVATDDVPAVKAYREQIVQVRAEIGTRVNKLETVINRMSADRILLTDRLEDTQGVALDKTLVDLTTAETGYRSALIAVSRAQDLSLANYL